MPTYLVKANYSPDGVKGLLKEGGSSRRTAIEKMADSLGCKVVGFYYAFGETDLYVLWEAPDNISAAAGSLLVNAAGAVSCNVTVLITPEELDEAARKTGRYTPPSA